MTTRESEQGRRLRYWMRVCLLLGLVAAIGAWTGLAGTLTTVSYVVFLFLMVCYIWAYMKWRRLPPIP